MREAIGTGATPQLALIEACRQLGKETYEVEFELLEEPKAKILGLFGGRPAKVRAYYDDAAENEPAQAPEKAPAKKPEAAAKPAAPEKAKPAAPKPVVVKAAEPAPVEAEVEPAAAEKEPSAAATAAAAYLKKILAGLGAARIDVEITEHDSGAELTITGEDASVVIGHHGETLSALQYLVGLVANHVQESYYRITLNTGNYREKREQTLIHLAKRMANKAVNTGRRQPLEPMNPYERRIIHTAVQEVEGATSWSEGVDMNRHVVIGPVDGGRPPRTNNRRGNNRRPNGNRPPRSSRPQNDRPQPQHAQQPVGTISDVAVKSHPPVEVAAAPAAPKQKKESGAVPLYGRIDVK